MPKSIDDALNELGAIYIFLVEFQLRLIVDHRTEKDVIGFRDSSGQAAGNALMYSAIRRCMASFGNSP